MLTQVKTFITVESLCLFSETSKWTKLVKLMVDNTHYTFIIYHTYNFIIKSIYIKKILQMPIQPIISKSFVFFPQKVYLENTPSFFHTILACLDPCHFIRLKT